MSSAQRILRLCATAFCLLWLAWPCAGQEPDVRIQQSIDRLKQLKPLSEQHRYREAEQLLKGVIRDLEQGDNVFMTTAALSLLAGLYQETGRFDEAERIALRGVELAKRHDDAKALAPALQILGQVHRHQRRFAEAEAELRQVLALTERRWGTDSIEYAQILEDLAIVLDDTGRFQDAEPLFQRALAIRYRALGPKSYDVARSYQNLGYLYYQHARLDDAYDYLRHAVKIFGEASGGVTLCSTLINLIRVCKDSRRWDEAKMYQQQLKQLYLKEFGPKEEYTVTSDGLLGEIFVAQNKFAEAEPLFLRKEEFLARQPNPSVRSTASVQSSLAEICIGLGRYAEAEELISQLLTTLKTMENMTSERCSAHFVRGRIYFERQKLDLAIADLRESVKLAEDIRSRLSGSDQQRAGSFSTSLRDKYLLLFRALLEKGDLPAALAIAEQGRARSLFDQMQTAHADLLAGLPTAQAQALRLAMNQAEAQVPQLEKQLEATANDAGLSLKERQSRHEELGNKLMAARGQLVDAHTAIRNASPLYRKTLAKDFQPVSLTEIDAWLGQRKSCLLYYMLDDDRAVVVARGPQQRDQLVQVLEATAEQAKVLGIAAGPLNGEILEQVLQGKGGVLPHLANPDTNKQAEARLAVLWEVLVPAEIRAALVKDEYKNLVIVPDGALGLLPFETLIVEAGEEPTFLLDVGPPITYAPSLTLLHTLAARSAVDPKAKSEQTILTIGDPIYGEVANDPSQARTAGMRTRYGALGGKLVRLPYTASESHWVQQALKPAGWSAVQLLESQATEAALRSKIEGRAIVHLACHGLTDQAYGNFFGALALTPGPRGSLSSNDGFLTLAEVCELDLRGNELTMLSACQTNYGPQQQGEGVWALTRGFLVAGSRRVMASNWVVDDKAAATLVYYFALNIAAGQQSGELDYALALHKAKQAVRKQSKWQSPYYWGTFVLVGPN